MILAVPRGRWWVAQTQRGHERRSHAKYVRRRLRDLSGRLHVITRGFELAPSARKLGRVARERACRVGAQNRVTDEQAGG